MIGCAWYQGRRLTIWFTPEATQSWHGVESQVPEACVVRLLALLQRLADVGKIRSQDAFEDYGENIFAVKTRCGLRAYGWVDGKCLVISHCLYNSNRKFSDSDRNTVRRNIDLYKTGANDHGS